MQFGKRLNVSGVAGLLLIPILLLLGVPPLVATAAGYFTRSMFVEYATLTAFAALSVVSYLLVSRMQGRSLERREIEILEVVREPTEI
jgi:membrane protein implicated in regulation of membrane protease activity